MELDPGSHNFRVEGASATTPISTDVVVREGEKLKVVRIELPSTKKIAPSTPVKPPVTNRGGPKQWRMTFSSCWE